MTTEVINYTDWFIGEVNKQAKTTRLLNDSYFIGELYYDMIDAIEDDYTLEVE